MSEKSTFKVLVFSKTSGYRHSSITAGLAAIRALADREKKFTIDATEDAETAITASSLATYAVVVLLQNTGDFLNSSQLDVLKEFVKNGGGVVAIHGAAAGLLENEWYGKLIGAHFDMHPDPEGGKVVVEEQNAEHVILCGCSGREVWVDEWYNFTSHPRENANLKVLLRGDTATFSGGKMGDDHPLSWYQEFEGGRVFYTALGHFEEAYTDKWFMGQVHRGILWAARREDDVGKER